MLNRQPVIVSINLFAILLFGSVSAQESNSKDNKFEETLDEGSRRCLSTRGIRRLKIIDDRNVLIYQNTGKVFHNVLRYNCNGLKRVGSFSYNSSDGNLCEGDGIAAINGAWDDVRPMPTCWMGIHREISREEAKALQDGGKRGPKIETRPLPMPDPEEVDTVEDDPDT